MSVKLMMCGRRRAGQTVQAHRAHMKDVHGAIVLKYIAEQPDFAPRRYVQNHGFDGAFSGGDPAVAPLALGFDFVTEIWFPDAASAKASQQTDFYHAHLFPDEPRMVDTARVIGRPYGETRKTFAPFGPAYTKVFIILGADADIAVDYFDTMSGPLGHSSNTALVPSPIARIEQFWFADGPAAYAFLAACSKGLNLGQTPSIAVVLAQEIVLHAGAMGA